MTITAMLSDMRDALSAQAENLPDHMIHLRQEIQDLIEYIERELPLFHDNESAKEDRTHDD